MNQVYTMAGMEPSHRLTAGCTLVSRDVRAHPEGLGLSVAELREEIWREVAHWQSGGIAQDCGALAACTADFRTMTALQPLRLRSLLGLDGAAFIAATYHTLLGRPPDQTGFTQLTAELGRGRSKLDILRGVQLSAEARERGERLRGLHMRYFLQRLRRPPISLLRLGRRVLRAPDAPKPASGGPCQDDRAPALAESWPTRLEQRLAEQQAALHLITARLGALQAAQEELGRKTLAALAEQDRLLRKYTDRDAGMARQAVTTEDELVTAASSLSDELGTLSRRLAAIELDGVAPLQIEPAR